jgi:amino acid transporter
MISTFGSVMGTILVNPRIFFALAEDKLFFQSIARVHPKYQTPHVAILLTGALGIFFVLTQTFEQLADTFVLTMWPFYALSVAAIYRLRRTRPDLPRPYKVIGYPVVPALFILGAIYLVGNAIWHEPLWTSVTFGIVLAGAPVYWVMFRK